MKQVTYGNIVSYVPESLSQLIKSDFLKLADLFVLGKPKAESRLIFAKTVFPEITDLIYKELNAITVGDFSDEAIKRYEELTQDLTFLSNQISWVFKPESFVTDRWFLTEVKVKSGVFKGWNDKLSNVSFWQFCLADIYLTRYKNTNDKSCLYKFAACVFVPNHETFKESSIIGNSIKLTQMKESELYATQINFIAIKAWLRRLFKEVFKTTSTVREIDGQKPVDLGRMYAKLLLSIAKRRMMDEDVIANKNVLTVFEDQNDEIEKMNEYKEKLKNSTTKH